MGEGAAAEDSEGLGRPHVTGIYVRYCWRLGQIHAEADLKGIQKYKAMVFLQKDLCGDGKRYVTSKCLCLTSRHLGR